MRILLDENVPANIALSAEFDVRTVREMKWLGTKNGTLLRMAASSGFDVMITADRNLYHQQNLRALPIAVLLVPKNRSKLLERIVRAIEENLRALRSKGFTITDLGENQDNWPSANLYAIERSDQTAKHIFRREIGPVE